MAGYVDFAEVKARVSIRDAVSLLGLDLADRGEQQRGECPACKRGGNRALVVTPGKNLFYCFAAEKGGDQLALVAHIRDCSPKEAAAFLGGTDPKEKPTERKKPSEGFKPLDYLDPHHPAVEAVGFAPEDAEALGIGYAPRGVLRGTVAVPVRLEDGRLAGYIGITEAKMPPKWDI